MKIKLFVRLITLFITAGLIVAFSSCSETEEIIKTVISNDVAAKDRLDSAIAQAKRNYGDSTKLFLIFGKNVKSNGKTDISTISIITNPDSVGAWMYIFRAPADTSLRIYTPNPLPGANDCIELTALFNTNMILSLIQDTSARNIVGGALSFITSSGVSITTTVPNLVNSDISLDYANTTNPIIKFNSNYQPDTSSVNGNVFFSSGTNQTRNMFLVPAAGTLNLPNFIQNLTGFPNDLWIVNYKKQNAFGLTENLILGTVVETNQQMSIPPPIGLTSKVINISKYVSE